jgi:hypothetical protein
VPDPQERPARNITHARRFDDNRARSSFGESPVPIKIVAGHETVVGCPPGNHRRNPRPALKRETADLDRLEEKRLRRFFYSRPSCLWNCVSNWVLEAPHIISVSEVKECNSFAFK